MAAIVIAAMGLGLVLWAQGREAHPAEDGRAFGPHFRQTFGPGR